jgi:hypothetical protein
LNALTSPEAIAASIGALAIILVALIAVVAYPLQKRWDRREQRRELDTRASMDLLEAIGALAAAHFAPPEEREQNGAMDDAQQKYAISKMRFVAVANDQAIKKLTNLDSYFSGQKTGHASEINDAVIGLARAIRTQTLDCSNLTDEELLGATPFNLEKEV